MKFIKFIYTPIKFILLLGMIAAVIYFRSIIFQPNINQYINAGLSFAEDKLDISIPSHHASATQAEAVTMVVHEECEFDEPKIAETEQVNKNMPVQAEAGKAEGAAGVPGTVSSPVATGNDMKSNDDDSLIGGIAEALKTVNDKVDAMFEDASKQVPMDKPQEDVAIAETPDSGNTQSAANDVASLNNYKPIVPAKGNQTVPDSNQVLMMARQSYWAGKLSKSEAYYLDLTRMNNAEPDIYGELGNVYYAQGKWKQAGEAYYQAAVRLLALNQDQKNSKRVSYLLRVIQGLDMESAEKLKSKISG